ncbi:RNA-directed DNA polymerase (reverse transcriptase)-related family protein [Rhynchospora pubera]|uniref:RNA-directed DNA polymerase (Reverse transcriptase)-related family protein n=1 Tax=Rhynchospora pubera TaxID=906938 RepID=A0AAV8FB14_9POAL|nr:RNA-directed DNA polymerase (reverse transcriptase)-related family protein [Rhynchospora pubera]
MVMIKSVLMSMPVYSMSLEMLPKGCVQDINRLLAKFFWGKIGQDRYMSFVSWKKVCQKTENGGLGVKDLQLFGEALFLKLVWSLMADDDKAWVQVCKAKYFPVVGFWRAKKGGSGSRMWGQIVKMREFFKNDVTWHLGTGETVNVLSQPWFQNWTVQHEATHIDRKMKVRSLIDEQNGDWHLQELTRLFQRDQVQCILRSHNKPDLLTTQRDRLVWHKTNSGTYSVKEGYKELTQMQPAMQGVQTVNWLSIWNCKSITPKVQIFLWRLLSRALPVAVNMHARIAGFPPTRQRCNEENEYEMHCLFFCHTSRQVWFGSQLGLRVHELPLNVNTAIQQIMGSLDEEGNKIFANTLWEIWKERNKAVIERGHFKSHAVIQRIKTTSAGTSVQMNMGPTNTKRFNQDKYEFYSTGWQVLIDASWDCSMQAGAGFVVYNKGYVYGVGLHYFTVHDSFHAEAMAMKEAMTYIFTVLNLPRGTKVQFFSDCLNLITAVNQGDSTELPSWRVLHVVSYLIEQMETTQTDTTIHFARRDAVQQAHELANVARRQAVTYQGRPHMALQQEGKLNKEIDEKVFSKGLE